MSDTEEALQSACEGGNSLACQLLALDGKPVKKQTLEGEILDPHLHLKWTSNCYLAYSEFYFEAWFTKYSDPNSERLPVDSLVLRWRHGDVRGEEVGYNTGMVAKSDRTYGVFGCEDDICAIAIATLGGTQYAMAAPDACSWA